MSDIQDLIDREERIFRNRTRVIVSLIVLNLTTLLFAVARMLGI